MNEPKPIIIDATGNNTRRRLIEEMKVYDALEMKKRYGLHSIGEVHQLLISYGIFPYTRKNHKNIIQLIFHKIFVLCKGNFDAFRKYLTELFNGRSFTSIKYIFKALNYKCIQTNIDRFDFIEEMKKFGITYIEGDKDLTFNDLPNTCVKLGCFEEVSELIFPIKKEFMMEEEKGEKMQSNVIEKVQQIDNEISEKYNSKFLGLDYKGRCYFIKNFINANLNENSEMTSRDYYFKKLIFILNLEYENANKVKEFIFMHNGFEFIRNEKIRNIAINECGRDFRKFRLWLLKEFIMNDNLYKKSVLNVLYKNGFCRSLKNNANINAALNKYFGARVSLSSKKDLEVNDSVCSINFDSYKYLANALHYPLANNENVNINISDYKEAINALVDEGRLVLKNEVDINEKELFEKSFTFSEILEKYDKVINKVEHTSIIVKPETKKENILPAPKVVLDTITEPEEPKECISAVANNEYPTTIRDVSEDIKDENNIELVDDKIFKEEEETNKVNIYPQKAVFIIKENSNSRNILELIERMINDNVEFELKIKKL